MAFPVLETERMVLREIVPADARALLAFRSEPDEQKHNDAPLVHIDESHALIERLAAEYRDVSLFVMLRRDRATPGPPASA
ncbi:GNAT family N-acetyltransferase [Pseudonocardia sp. GCM10023141]|uniref:GNAT family N-acetyltransferase n=1 Tax=Pseudonocardia sp. GCM10023141 TaxID=3252653 RepID=UPI0036064425